MLKDCHLGIFVFQGLERSFASLYENFVEIYGSKRERAEIGKFGSLQARPFNLRLLI